MTPELQEALLKALYAGHKYHLATESAIDCYERGDVDTPTNGKLIERYYTEWQEWTKRAVELHEDNPA